MKRANLVLLALAALVVITAPGCGGKKSPVADIKAAIGKSSQTYLGFRNRLYWGRPVHFAITGVNVSKQDDHFATALVLAFEKNGKWAGHSQRVLLERTSQWQVIAAASDGPNAFPCRYAPAGVVRALVGSCTKSPSPSYYVTPIEGVSSNRPATTREQAAIIAAARAHNSLAGHDGCVRYKVRISRFNSRYASVTYTSFRPYGASCSPMNTVSLMTQTASGRWLVLAQESTTFECKSAPPGVIRSLFGRCWIVNKRSPIPA